MALTTSWRVSSAMLSRLSERRVRNVSPALACASAGWSLKASCTCGFRALKKKRTVAMVSRIAATTHATAMNRFRLMGLPQCC